MISGIKTHRQTEGNTDGAILDCSITDQILTRGLFKVSFHCRRHTGLGTLSSLISECHRPLLSATAQVCHVLK